MPSLLANWVMKTKLEVTLEEANRLGLLTIDLRSHGLDTLPLWSMHCNQAHVKAVKCLLLQLNHLTEFSRLTCHTLTNLKALTLDYNNLEDLPFDLRNFTNLTMLNVSHNDFSSLHFFYVITTLKNLRVLWANATGLSEIPREIEFLQNLRILGLRRNSIRRLPRELFTLRNLEWLTISHNLIREVPGEIVNLRHLVHLNLSWNRLTKLPLNFNSIEDLQYVFLEYNRLTIDDDLTKFIGSMPNLKCCWVAGNLPDPSNPDYVPIQEIDRRGEGPNDTPVVNLTPWSVSTQSLLEQNDDASSLYASTYNGPTIPVITSMSQMRVVPPPNPVGSGLPGLGGRQREGLHRISEVDTADLLTVYRNINDPKNSRNVLESTLHETETIPSVHSHGTTNVSRWSLILPDQSKGGEGLSGESPVSLRPSPQREYGHDGPNILGNPENFHIDLVRAGKIDGIERANLCLDYENGNSSENMYRMARIHEWVTHQAESILADKSDLEGNDNVWSKCMINNGNSEELLEEANDTSMTQLFKEIEVEVNSIFKDAAAECQQHPFPDTRRSMAYLSRQRGRNRSDLQFIEGVQASFHSRRSATRIESTANDHTRVPTDNGCSLTNGGNYRDPDLYSANDVSISGFNNDSTGNDMGDVIPVRSEELGQLVSALWSQGDDTDSINYAPSDWENSAPSSAIDDQDFASRFVDVNLEEEEEARRELLLGDFDILNMIRHIIVLPS